MESKKGVREKEKIEIPKQSVSKYCACCVLKIVVMLLVDALCVLHIGEPNSIATAHACC